MLVRGGTVLTRMNAGENELLYNGTNGGRIYPLHSQEGDKRTQHDSKPTTQSGRGRARGLLIVIRVGPLAPFLTAWLVLVCVWSLAPSLLSRGGADLLPV